MNIAHIDHYAFVEAERQTLNMVRQISNAAHFDLTHSPEALLPSVEQLADLLL